MLMGRIIQMNGDEMSNISGILHQSADILNGIISDLNSKYQVLRGGDFVGAAANKFFDDMENIVFPELNKLLQFFQDGGSGTKQISDKILEAQARITALKNR